MQDLEEYMEPLAAFAERDMVKDGGQIVETGHAELADAMPGEQIEKAP